VSVLFFIISYSLFFTARHLSHSQARLNRDKEHQISPNKRNRLISGFFTEPYAKRKHLMKC